jgi:N-acetylmuramic acid 6-phosphate etherase
VDLAHLPTEQHRAELADLDLRPTLDLVRLMAADEAEAQEAVTAAAPSIAAAVDAVVERLQRGGRLIYVGAGTAGRLGLLDAAECPPTFNTEQVLAVMAGGPDAFLFSQGEEEDDTAAGAADMDRTGVSEKDAVVGVAASGRTPYTVGAVIRARQLGAVTVGISSNPDAVLSLEVDHPIEVVVGPEIIAGSTRLKAGSAQKTVLNMISTISMVRLGKTFGNLMVDVQATNAKLRERARRIVLQATGAGLEAVDQALIEADGEVKVAILILLTGADAAGARERLAAHHGVVRRALEGE